MTSGQIFACTVAWSAAIVAVWVLVLMRRGQGGRPRGHAVPYTPPPREYCGNLAPQIFEHSPRAECVLRPGHSGSHANERGARWWYDPTLTPKEEQ